MNHFSIRDIENLCGIRAHTLRIWEQRYRLCVAKRKESRHRIYDNEDLKELLRIAFLYHHGYKISRIAAMDPAGIQQAIITVGSNTCSYDVYIHELLEASIDLDKEAFDNAVHTAVRRLGLEKAIFSVFYPFLQRIGLLWMTNHVIPAQEHFCTHIIRKKIICAIDGLGSPENSTTKVLLFAPDGEHHEIPLLAADYLLKKNGIRTIYFGTGTALETLDTYLQFHPVELIFTHVTSCPKDSGFDEYLAELCKKFPGKTILMSGPSTRYIRHKPPQAILLEEPMDLVNRIREMERKQGTRLK